MGFDSCKQSIIYIYIYIYIYNICYDIAHKLQTSEQGHNWSKTVTSKFEYVENIIITKRFCEFYHVPWSQQLNISIIDLFR